MKKLLREALRYQEQEQELITTKKMMKTKAKATSMMHQIISVIEITTMTTLMKYHMTRKARNIEPVVIVKLKQKQKMMLTMKIAIPEKLLNELLIHLVT